MLTSIKGRNLNIIEIRRRNIESIKLLREYLTKEKKNCGVSFSNQSFNICLKKMIYPSNKTPSDCILGKVSLCNCFLMYNGDHNELNRHRIP